jgi:hypothetical protein
MQKQRSVADRTRNVSRRGPLPELRVEIVRGLIKNYGCQSPMSPASGNLDFRGFEDPYDRFVELLNSVPSGVSTTRTAHLVYDL